MIERQEESRGLKHEIAARRTFAIISHPDAGKTTLTEKLLLYSGMVRTAGMVRGRKQRKAASSDWMQMEQERGISITASAMQFDYMGYTINVLDTPGHQDFSEDTYRTLTAADCAIMVIDAAKGVEKQTLKLFEVCRMRGIPILTFVNKMDLPAKEALELLHEIEEVLGIPACAINWPIGSGKTFKGIVDRNNEQVELFEKTSAGGAQKAKRTSILLSELEANGDLLEEEKEKIYFDLELLKEAGDSFSKEAFLAGKITPTFFGSALTNFGLEPFFEAFVELAPQPGGREAIEEESKDKIEVDPYSPFSAYFFKIQANMDPNHRDSTAFMRIVSGVFERDMMVFHVGSGKEIRLARSHRMLAGSRDTLELAYPGDIVGVNNSASFKIGDTISKSGTFSFLPMPQFPPEVVAKIRPKDVSKRKAFDKGIKQISTEGAVQVLLQDKAPSSDPLIAAVGKLQFEVVQFRLESEYKVKTVLEHLPYKHGSWLIGEPSTFCNSSNSVLAENAFGQHIVLYRSEWEKGYLEEQNPQHELVDFISPVQ